MCHSQNTPTMLPLGCKEIGQGWHKNTAMPHPQKAHSANLYLWQKDSIQVTVLLLIILITSFFPVHSSGGVLYFNGDPAGSAASDKTVTEAPDSKVFKAKAWDPSVELESLSCFKHICRTEWMLINLSIQVLSLVPGGG